MSVRSMIDQLRKAGLTEAGIFGLLGNWQCESGLEAGRLQGDFSPYRTTSKDYVARATNGSMSRETFARDAKGFGLAQWTYFSRKYALWDYWKQSGVGLDSDEMQVAFALRELASDYSGLLSFLKTSDDLYSCTERVCKEFERPAVNNVSARFSAAQTLREQFGGINTPPDETPAQNAAETPTQGDSENVGNSDSEFWPPRMICRGMTGADVMVLQSVLKARGWGITEADGNFGSFLEGFVKQFQSKNKLDDDGIVGPLTWGKLLER